MARFLIIIILTSLAISGCATTYNPGTGQKEFILITTPIEISIGKAVSSNVVSQFKISSDKEKISRLQEIGGKIAKVSDRKDIPYQFQIIEDNALNAFTIPGGYIYVNSGIMDKASDDELACVIGHEVGHTAARHTVKKMQAQMGYDILLNIASRQAGLGELQRAASISFNLIMLGYSREDELLGDRLGVKYAYKAGYDPYAMITFLEKIKEANPNEMGFVFLRSHPYASKRIETLKKEIPFIIEKADKKTLLYNAAKNEEDAITRRMCPKCRRIFSGQIKYCPYDGTKF